MKQYKRLPRKLKKKVGPSWRDYLQKQNTILVRDYHLDKIFTENYEDGAAVVQRIINAH